MARQLNSFEANSLRLLERKINELIDVNAEQLAFGNAIQDGTEVTLRNYLTTVGFVRGLHTAIELCKSVEDELLGRTKSQSVPAPN